MNLITAVVDDAEGIEAVPNMTNKILLKLNDLLVVLKDAANDLRILAIKVLEKFVNIKSLTDAQFISICDAMIDTSDKS